MAKKDEKEVSIQLDRREFIKLSAAMGAATLVGYDPVFGTIREAFAEAPKAEKWFISVCPYCGTGCGVNVGVAKGKVVAVKGMEDHPINRGELCILGKNLILPDGRLSNAGMDRQDMHQLRYLHRQMPRRGAEFSA